MRCQRMVASVAGGLGGKDVKGEKPVGEEDEAGVDKDAVKTGFNDFIEVGLRAAEREDLHDVGCCESGEKDEQDLQSDDAGGHKSSRRNGLRSVRECWAESLREAGMRTGVVRAMSLFLRHPSAGRGKS